MALDPLTALFDLVKMGAEKIWPDANKRGEQLQKLQELQQAGKSAELAAELAVIMGQLEINKVEAANTNVFVSGWRPAVGWVCGFALGYATIIEPTARFVAVVWFDYSGEFPHIETELTWQALSGILGLGGFRMYEKVKGVASK